MSSDCETERNTNVWGISHSEAVSEDCVAAGQSEIETFSGNAWEETKFWAIFLVFLLMFFRLRPPKSLAKRS